MLTDDEIQQSIEAGERVYREHRGNVRGMTVQPIDDVTYCIARAVERAVGAGMTDTKTIDLITECRDALAEELSGWDIDPPLHHVKQAHDKCVEWLAAQSSAPLSRIETKEPQ